MASCLPPQPPKAQNQRSENGELQPCLNGSAPHEQILVPSDPIPCPIYPCPRLSPLKPKQIKVDPFRQSVKLLNAKPQTVLLLDILSYSPAWRWPIVRWSFRAVGPFENFVIGLKSPLIAEECCFKIGAVQAHSQIRCQINVDTNTFIYELVRNGSNESSIKGSSKTHTSHQSSGSSKKMETIKIPIELHKAEIFLTMQGAGSLLCLEGLESTNNQLAASLGLNPFQTLPSSPVSQQKLDADGLSSSVKRTLQRQRPQKASFVESYQKHLFIVCGNKLQIIRRADETKQFSRSRVIYCAATQTLAIQIEEGDVCLMKSFLTEMRLPNLLSDNQPTLTTDEWVSFGRDVFSKLQDKLLQLQSSQFSQESQNSVFPTYRAFCQLFSELRYYLPNCVSWPLNFQIDQFIALVRTKKLFEKSLHGAASTLRNGQEQIIYQAQKLLKVELQKTKQGDKNTIVASRLLPQLHFQFIIESAILTFPYLVVTSLVGQSKIYNLRISPILAASVNLSHGVNKKDALQETGAVIADQQWTESPQIYRILTDTLKEANKALINKVKNTQPVNLQSPKQARLIPDAKLLKTLVEMGFGAQISSQALISCANLSLQAAVDVAITLSSTPAVSAKPDELVCGECTLVNLKGSTECQACQTSFKTPKSVPRKQDQKIEEPPEILPFQTSSEAILKPLCFGAVAIKTNICECPIIMVGLFSDRLRIRLLYLNFCYAKAQKRYFSDCNAPLQEQMWLAHLLTADSQQTKQDGFCLKPLEDMDIYFNCQKGAKIESHSMSSNILAVSIQLTTKQVSNYKIEINRKTLFSQLPALKLVEPQTATKAKSQLENSSQLYEFHLSSSLSDSVVTRAAPCISQVPQGEELADQPHHLLLQRQNSSTLVLRHTKGVLFSVDKIKFSLSSIQSLSGCFWMTGHPHTPPSERWSFECVATTQAVSMVSACSFGTYLVIQLNRDVSWANLKAIQVYGQTTSALNSPKQSINWHLCDPAGTPIDSNLCTHQWSSSLVNPLGAIVSWKLEVVVPADRQHLGLNDIVGWKCFSSSHRITSKPKHNILTQHQFSQILQVGVACGFQVDLRLFLRPQYRSYKISYELALKVVHAIASHGDKVHQKSKLLELMSQMLSWQTDLDNSDILQALSQIPSTTSQMASLICRALEGRKHMNPLGMLDFFWKSLKSARLTLTPKEVLGSVTMGDELNNDNYIYSRSYVHMTSLRMNISIDLTGLYEVEEVLLLMPKHQCSIAYSYSLKIIDRESEQLTLIASGVIDSRVQLFRNQKDQYSLLSIKVNRVLTRNLILSINSSSNYEGNKYIPQVIPVVFGEFICEHPSSSLAMFAPLDFKQQFIVKMGRIAKLRTAQCTVYDSISLDLYSRSISPKQQAALCALGNLKQIQDINSVHIIEIDYNKLLAKLTRIKGTVLANGLEQLLIKWSRSKAVLIKLLEVTDLQACAILPSIVSRGKMLVEFDSSINDQLANSKEMLANICTLLVKGHKINVNYAETVASTIYQDRQKLKVLETIISLYGWLDSLDKGLEGLLSSANRQKLIPFVKICPNAQRLLQAMESLPSQSQCLFSALAIHIDFKKLSEYSFNKFIEDLLAHPAQQNLLLIARVNNARPLPKQAVCKAIEITFSNHEWYNLLYDFIKLGLFSSQPALIKAGTLLAQNYQKVADEDLSLTILEYVMECLTPEKEDQKDQLCQAIVKCLLNCLSQPPYELNRRKIQALLRITESCNSPTNLQSSNILELMQWRVFSTDYILTYCSPKGLSQSLDNFVKLLLVTHLNELDQAALNSLLNSFFEKIEDVFSIEEEHSIRLTTMKCNLASLVVDLSSVSGFLFYPKVFSFLMNQVTSFLESNLDEKQDSFKIHETAAYSSGQDRFFNIQLHPPYFGELTLKNQNLFLPYGAVLRFKSQDGPIPHKIVVESHHEQGNKTWFGQMVKQPEANDFVDFLFPFVTQIPVGSLVFTAFILQRPNVLEPEQLYKIKVSSLLVFGEQAGRSMGLNLIKCLEKYCHQDNASLLKKILAVPSNLSVLEKMQTCLARTDVEGGQQILEKLTLAVCSVNDSVANSMLSKLISKEQIYNNMNVIANIITLSDASNTQTRFQSLLSFVTSVLRQHQAVCEVDQTKPEDPWILGYLIAQVLAVIRAKFNKYLSFDIDCGFLRQLLEIQKRHLQAQRFLCSIISALHATKEVQWGFGKLFGTIITNHTKSNSQLLISLVLTDPTTRDIFLKSKCINAKFQQAITLITQKDTTQKLLTQITSIGLLCTNSAVKNQFNKAGLAIKIIKAMLSPEYLSELCKEGNDKLRKKFVKFVSRTVCGFEAERDVAQILKECLHLKIFQENNKIFITQVFMPLLNSTEKIFLSVMAYNSEQNCFMFDNPGNQLTDREDLSEPSTSPFLNINCSDKQFLDKVCSEIGKLPPGQFASQHTYMKKRQIIKQKVKRSTSRLLCLFTLKYPAQGYAVMAIYLDKDVALNGPFVLDQKCFFAYKILDQQIVCERPAGMVIQFEPFQGQSAPTLEVKRPGGKVLIEFKKNVNNVYLEVHTFTIESAQYFSFHPKKLKKPSASTAAKIIQKSQLRRDTGEVMSLLNNKNQYLKTQSSQQIKFIDSISEAPHAVLPARSVAIYEVPVSLTIKELFRLTRFYGVPINKAKLTYQPFSLVSQPQLDIGKFTMKELVKLSSQEVIDLQFQPADFLCAINSQPLQTDSNQNMVDPKPILQCFQTIGGLKTMLLILQQSINFWKNETLRQKWSQYTRELILFSNFPNFFSIHIENAASSKLLFELLEGQPDIDTKGKNWDEVESTASKNLLRTFLSLLKSETDKKFKKQVMESGYLFVILDRLGISTGLYKRQFDSNAVESDPETAEQSNQQAKPSNSPTKSKKKKGIGYGPDINSNTKWMKQLPQVYKKEFQITGILLEIIGHFLNLTDPTFYTKDLVHKILCSSLLPYIEEALRAGTLLEMSKFSEKYVKIMEILRKIGHKQLLVPLILDVPVQYQPKQNESIISLLRQLNSTAEIFIKCSEKSNSDSEKLANDIITTTQQLQNAIGEMESIYSQPANNEAQFTQVMKLPLDKRYGELLKGLRFGFIELKKDNTTVKHHYQNFYNTKSSSSVKSIRLAQQIADLSTALPYQHTNAIYVRCDKKRIDFMQALIMGSNGTPYAHGAYLFDIYFEDSYPNTPPKVNLMTTGHGKIRFNPNLYSCGKVCLSLLGTWRGSVSENWDPKVSTLLQVLISIQAIIMSEDIYFNEPGFENEQGTADGDMKNEAYCNVVRCGNIKYAMVENLKNPPTGFEEVIRRHFYLKKDEILEECRSWQSIAETKNANYVGLASDHNNTWCAEFKKSKTAYREMLDKSISELEEAIAGILPISPQDIGTRVLTHVTKKKKEVKQSKRMEDLQKEEGEQIDVKYEHNSQKPAEELNIDDEKVKDRWSRYIGAMGIDAVSKQSKADIMLVGLGPLGCQVAKNIVLSGCRRFTVCDPDVVHLQDLSGGFFYAEEDVGKPRIASALYKIRQLNLYVKVDSLARNELSAERLKQYTVVIATGLLTGEAIALDLLCRQLGVKFIHADCNSAFFRVANDFGHEFEVADKNGQDPSEVYIKNLTKEEKGVVTLIDNTRNPFEDGQVVLIRNVAGMAQESDPSKSINGTLHKVELIDSKSFRIGNTIAYEPYKGNGTVKNVKTPVTLKFKPLKEIYSMKAQGFPFDGDLCYYDFTKEQKSFIVHACFDTMSEFLLDNKKTPSCWNLKEAGGFYERFKNKYPELNSEQIEKLAYLFAMTWQGYLPPLCAYVGGVVAQEALKAVTHKYKPINSVYCGHFAELIPSLEGSIKTWPQETLNKLVSTAERTRGCQIVMGITSLQSIQKAKLFMVGAGAIGCELLKNFAMVSLGNGPSGKITLTDPDHIENSNLNRQFLFREKHISKSKSRTAAATIQAMNPGLKNHISALQERISDTTKDIFSNGFFCSLDIVANALDNVAARRYVDQRCVENKIPLFESGTLGPKGHVQVIIPFKTQSYSSQNDPSEEGEIPHCTLKMFPEEPLHCVEWARDIFGKKFNLKPLALLKILDPAFKPEKQDTKTLVESLRMLEGQPKDFNDCIRFACLKFYKYFRDDILQLMHIYPLDAKTKDGQPFWKLPKRPPVPIEALDSKNPLHACFITSMAVLSAKIFGVSYPQDFRAPSRREVICKMAEQVKIAPFVPSHEKGKQILKETQNSGPKLSKEIEAEQQVPSQTVDEIGVYEKIKSFEKPKIHSEIFEKDDDANGHIDFIYAMTNLRATNYKLDTMDWITVKLKAGRIVPALATTTSCVAGLQTLEICKYLIKTAFVSMRNSYMNLAVPSLQMTEPGQVKKNKLTETLSVTLWDRWQVACSTKTTFRQLNQMLEQKYGLKARKFLQGTSILNQGLSSEDEEEFLNDTVGNRIEVEQGFADLVVLFSKPTNSTIIEGTPSVRLIVSDL